MDRDEKIAIKAACIEAAAALLAALPAPQPSAEGEGIGADTGNCARFARDLFGKLTGEPWE